MRKIIAAGIAVGMSFLLLGCESWDEQNQQAYSRASQAQMGRMAADGNLFPHGRRAPNLTGQERTQYQEAVALLEKGKNDLSVFDTSAAIAAELDADTKSLLAHQRTATQIAILNRGNEIRHQTNIRELPLEVSLLEGTVKDGKIDGPFDAVTRYEYLNRFATGTQSVVLMQRVQGNMVDGVLDGPLTVVRKMDSVIPGNPPLSVWNAGTFDYKDNRQVGTGIIYAENKDFNVTNVSRALPNGTYKAHGYVGNQISSVSITYQDKLHGAFRVYVDGRPAATTHYWNGTAVTAPQYVNTPEGKPLTTLTGVGMNYPRDLSGPFQVTDVYYPSPAASAGLLPGDIVLSIDGQRLTSAHNSSAVERMIAGAEGEDVVLEVNRPGLADSQSIRITRGKFQTMVPGQ